MASLEILKQAIFTGEDPAKVCDLMIVVAIEAHASDIHLEPLNDKVRLRYRVDGVLTEVLEYPTVNHPKSSLDTKSSVTSRWTDA